MSAIKKFEVTSDGIARIPKSTPVPVAASSSLGSADGDVPMVRRLDGTWEALPSKINNPNFAPRQAHPGGKIVTNDKDEVHVKFYMRKKVPIEQWPEHLRRKKEEMDAAAAASNAAKGGVHAMARGFAREFADDGVTFNVVAPCATESPDLSRFLEEDPAFAERFLQVIPLGRPASHADVAAAVLYLAGEEAGFVTGQVLSVNGGANMG